MKSDKVNLESKVTEVKNISNVQTSTKMNQNLLFTDGISFKDFMGQQLDFANNQSQLEQLSFTSVTSTDTKEVLKSTISQTVKAVNSEVVQNQEDVLIKESDKLEYDSYFTEEYLKIDFNKLSQDDMKQLQQLLPNNNIHVNINQINGFNNMPMNYNGSGISYKSLNVSKGLSEKLAQAYKTNKPVRIDFDNKSSVILKIDKDGKLSAQFLSSDKAMEMMLRDNLQALRSRLDDQGLPYKELSYKQQRDNEKQERESKEDK